MEAYRLRLSLGIFGFILALIWVLPNLVNVEQIKWWPSKNKLNYGLDIQGGLHLVMGVDVEGVVKESTMRLIPTIKAELSKEGVQVKDVTSSMPQDGQLEISFDSTSKAKILEWMSKTYGTILQEMSADDNQAVYRYYDTYMLDYKKRVINQSIETIRNRIDQFGVAEPSISQQGNDRILVQLPGMSDAERAKELINTTAKLDFMIVSDELGLDKLTQMISEVEKAGNYSVTTMKYNEYVTKLNQDLASKLPPKTAVYFEKANNAAKMETGSIPYLLKTDTGLGGADLDDATVNFGQFGEPEVSLRFNSAGANKFAELTGSHIGKRMAIVLDKIVKSAPNIKDRIGGGRAVITLGGSRNRNDTMKEAQMISTALRAGALPATLEQLEERRVGPSLGADSIQKAKMGSYIGALLIMIFMLVYYKSMGVIATVSLGINILSVFALLTSFGATLTLPGIAGIALTVGFAVDANVLIQERIKEELKNGSSWKLAIKEGYQRAMSAILDSNITTAATAVVLLYFGTGPVRGFAVTLLIGIATTLFGNVFISKLIVDTLIHKLGVKKLSV